MSTVKIINGKNGWHLMVNGLYINHGLNKEIRAISNDIGIPSGATEWVSIKAIIEFWHEYRCLILHATTTPVRSFWGQLQFIEQ